ncbi:type II secretion system protein GspG [Planctomycetales bacterium]|nr:type II secretion system protein GspG [Planctomycetales bacterium]
MQKGFTLLEVMVVLFILMIMAGLAVTGVLQQQRKAQRDSTVVYVKALSGALDLYEQNIGRPPTTEQGLNALLQLPGDLPNQNKWAGPYLKQTAQTTDPWGNTYQYVSPSNRSPGASYDVWSFGPDGVDGTDDDIGQWTND